ITAFKTEKFKAINIRSFVPIHAKPQHQQVLAQIMLNVNNKRYLKHRL
ncbi:hypothetical protein EVA_08249, partial [gut metagenome]